MKCKAFASQLEAHVGQSPVRGGEAIKPHRKSPPITTLSASQCRALYDSVDGICLGYAS